MNLQKMPTRNLHLFRFVYYRAVQEISDEGKIDFKTLTNGQ